MKRAVFAITLSLILLLSCITSLKAQDNNIRKQWLAYMDKVARPVLSNLAANTLKEKMPLVLSEKVDSPLLRTKASYLEAFARTLSGIAPWLQLDEGDAAEKKLRDEYRQMALKALANAVNPNAKDYLQWKGGQP